MTCRVRRANPWTSVLVVLVAGGCSQEPMPDGAPTGSATFALAGTWSAAGSLAEARGGHTATLLPSGRVLVAGGLTYYYYGTDSAELFDPGSGAWASTGLMTTARGYHTATPLDSGEVLVAGGMTDYYTERSAELYDGTTGRWTATGSMAIARVAHAAVRLPSGRVLVTGGDDGSRPVASAEVYDPATRRWTVAASMAQARTGHAAVLLPSGRALVVGGWSATWALVGAAEQYAPATDSWSSAGTLATPRAAGRAIVLASGRVLFAGGCSRVDSDGYCLAASAEADLYDPATGTWTRTGAMVSPRAWFGASLLPDGRVLAAGGCTVYYYGYCEGYARSAELYDPATGRWTTTGSMSEMRVLPGTTLLGTGGVLASAGFDDYDVLDSAEVYDSGVGAGCEVCGGDGTCVEMFAGAPCGACSVCDAAGACVAAPRGTACGVCAGCDDAGGCTVAVTDDPACGTIDCDGLDTACRDYDDVETWRCGGVGTCKPPNDEATCTVFEDVAAGTRCGSGFGDGFEASSSDWVLDSPWARTRSRARGGSWSLTDSPSGDYAGGVDISATMARPMSFTGAGSPTLTFWHQYDIDDYGDYASVEVQVDGGEWDYLDYYSGRRTSWEFVEIPLAAFAGEPRVRFRFRLMASSYSYGGDGWYIDDVQITGTIGECEQCDGAGTCGPVDDGTPCLDDDLCNGDEVCTAGECAAPSPLYCDDGDMCSVDSCEASRGCVHAPASEGLPCSSPLVCGGICLGGRCTGDRPASCDDDNDCTADSCDVPARACVNEPRPDGAPCEDGDQCTAGGRCAAGVCAGGIPVTCDDGEPCTADWCDPAEGCRTFNVADGTACDDRSVCTLGDACRTGVCTGTTLDCDDGNPCTTDSCDPVAGCGYAPAPGEPCDDGDDSTSDDACTAGRCVGTVVGDGCGCRAAAPRPVATLAGLLAALAMLAIGRRRRDPAG